MTTINLNEYLANLTDARLNQIWEDLVDADIKDIKLNPKKEIGYISKDFVYNEMEKRGLIQYDEEGLPLLDY